MSIKVKSMQKTIKSAKKSRRTSQPKRRVINERREDMLIISSATQADIYVWAVSLAIMAAVLGVIVTLSIVKG